MRIRMTTPTDVDAVVSLATEFATSFEVDKRPFLESFHQVMPDDHALLLVAAKARKSLATASALRHDTLFANGRVAWVEEINGEFTPQEEGVSDVRC